MEWEHEAEDSGVRCHVWGGEMRKAVTDLPFRLGDHRILVVENLPVDQCSSCSEGLIEDKIMTAVDAMVDGIDQAAELEVRQYAA